VAVSPALRHRPAAMRLEIQVARNLSYQVVSLQSRGKVPNYEASMAQNFGAAMGQRLRQVGMEFCGLVDQIGPGSPNAPMQDTPRKGSLGAVAATIGGGTSEVNRNVIATRGQGLPRG
jgi:alkylation response protein AidB-like acyl-CoA dehydrogenase